MFPTNISTRMFPIPQLERMVAYQDNKAKVSSAAKRISAPETQIEQIRKLSEFSIYQQNTNPLIKEIEANILKLGILPENNSNIKDDLEKGNMDSLKPIVRDMFISKMPNIQGIPSISVVKNDGSYLTESSMWLKVDYKVKMEDGQSLNLSKLYTLETLLKCNPPSAITEKKILLNLFVSFQIDSIIQGLKIKEPGIFNKNSTLFISDYDEDFIIISDPTNHLTIFNTNDIITADGSFKLGRFFPGADDLIELLKKDKSIDDEIEIAINDADFNGEPKDQYTYDISDHIIKTWSYYI